MSGSSTTESQSYHFLVVVLGDLGRSPRMQYHVLSLLEAGHSVTFLGYQGEALIPALLRFDSKVLQVVRFPAPKVKVLKSILLPAYFAWRLISLTLLLIMALFFVRKPDAILMQNPPALPSLAIMVAYKFITGAKLIVDWHNLGFSMIHEKHTVYRQVGRWYEELLGPWADGHLTVTRALSKFLVEDMGLTTNNLQVLYDCPPSSFRLRTPMEQHKILKAQHENLIDALSLTDWPEVSTPLNPAKQTLLTEEAAPRRMQPRLNRPALIVSSTSWTPDEDMSILIQALQQVDQTIQEQNSKLRIFCAITGKGPLKEYYQEEISKLTWKSVVIATMWMEPKDYPTFLATADLGISLHTSTSGKDLPIKILDYFGCEVPVCAYRFPCLGELVQDDVNGRTFETAPELADILFHLLKPLGEAGDKDRLANHGFGDLKRYSLQVQGQLLWGENWPHHAWPVIKKALEGDAAGEKSKSD